ncbi:hypothetical protein [Streptomyces acidiscabies]|uniref:Uncharacterized protein n=1 Tax=Streptomyces acidiscabies TaxID=42234 RepID=A0AAP6B6U5_9ACTN|nr:hypothetical protein [Streptomyces acidiscabies]MBP5939920.1 hypothetical protein [Streptomyces sp. LBUM 1476]MBZ3911109.1 hypothetical protein [Streptomyces acidiscabies]MDX2959110.1 hypothetical protein [Streptomyces acidiscabies]MDX3023958.1 hypothetical protein [Streptomyces acidiscabies]MDX3788221.1 hypothetical protein [Streptomyces acidiscabies]
MSPDRNGRGVGSLVAGVADVLALVLALWIALDLLDANRANKFVQFVHDAANWLAGWSRDLFTFDDRWARVVAGYGLAAVVYLVLGHAIANLGRRH